VRESRHSSLTWSSLGWLLPVAFLALPDCSFPGTGESPTQNLDPGGTPRNYAIFCDIEKKSEPPRCADTPADVNGGIALTHAAVALTKSVTSHVGLDYSPAARDPLGCEDDEPVVITFEGDFPAGLPVCVNAPSVLPPGPGNPYPDANAVCVARCKDFFGPVDMEGNVIPTVPATPENVAFCEQHARVSTSFPVSGDLTDFFGACDPAGRLRPEFETVGSGPLGRDPRRHAEPVPWSDVSAGVAVSGGLYLSTLTRTAVTTGQFDQGAASLQLITRGDGQVDFTVVETNTTRAYGLSSGMVPDVNPSLADIDFAIMLEAGSNLRIYESGIPILAPNGTYVFATYFPGDRVRIKFLDNFDGTASIAYFLIPAACQGPLCEGPLLRFIGAAPYPLHVDASLLTQGATLSDVRLVRIKTSNF
jgi:hypothetical protein